MSRRKKRFEKLAKQALRPDGPQQQDGLIGYLKLLIEQDRQNELDEKYASLKAADIEKNKGGNK